MKIRAVKKSYEDVIAKPVEKHRRPKKPNLFFRTLLKLVALPDLWATGFRYQKVNMEEISKKEPCLFLMNHSSFIDLEIVASMLYPRPFQIVATTDSFIGKAWLMRQIGCIPTKKFTTDTVLVRDMRYALKTLRSSVVLYPEASYSFDGTATTLPDSLGSLVKMMGVPVVMIETFGTFTRDPLYNNLQRRRVKVSATETCILTKEEVARMSPAELQEKIEGCFTFDQFRWQQENKVAVKENFRADYLNRVLYRCPHCETEGKTRGKGTVLRCEACGKEYELTPFGRMEAKEGVTEFAHIPDWYRYQREAVRQEILEERYRVELPVRIYVSRGIKHLYDVGEGTLLHTKAGFHLTGCDGALDYSQKALSSYSLYSDFNWYEVGDMVCIGDGSMLYYCFPKIEEDIVAKMRLATEEIYKIAKKKDRES